MKKEKSSFLEGKAFYAVLLLSLAAIGVSGYMIFFGQKDEAQTVAVETDTVEFRDTFLEEVMEKTSEKKAETPVVKEPEAPQTQVTAELKWIPPVSGSVVKSFSGNDLVYSETMGDWRTHNGVDLQAGTGSEVRAITDGVVTAVTNDALNGVSVTVKHVQGYQAVYQNLEEAVLCEAGDEVKAGTVLGRVGTTMATESEGQPHLHLEVTKNGSFVDPVTLFEKAEKQ